MRKKEIGYCHICGKHGVLTYEHIPPESALNNNPAIVYTGENAINRSKGEKAKYINLQKGMGKYSLCESCNNNTGSWYATVYSDLTKDVARALFKNKKLTHGDIVEFKFDNVPVLAFVKQIITMFCSLLPLKEVKRLGFDNFLLEKDSIEINTSLFDLRMYLTSKNTGQLMIGPTAILKGIDSKSIETTMVSDLGAYPFGFILNLTPEHPIEYGTSLMNLFEVEYGKEYNFRLTLMYLERKNENLPLPLQFKPLPKD